MSRPRPLIALLAAPTSSCSVLYGLYDVLITTGVAFADLTAGEPGEEAFDVRVVSLDGRPFECLGGVPVAPHAALPDLPQPEAIVVCDMYTPPDMPPVGLYSELARWLRHFHAQGALISSVCSGGVVLAETGLLDGREATAHWAYADLFARAYPKVRLRRECTLCLSAEADRIVTAGGTMSWQDLVLYLIARFCGTRRALETAKVHLLAAHGDGQLPYASINRRVNSSDMAIARCQEWIASHYAEPHPVQRMAEFAQLHPRTFARRFHAATGRSPLDYVHALRVEEAKQMLEVGEEPVDEVAAAVGYENPAAFRRLFQKLAGTTPAAYRRKFAALALHA